MYTSPPASQPNAPSTGHNCKPFLQLRTEVLGAGPELRHVGEPGFLRGVLGFVCPTGYPGSHMKLTTSLCFGDQVFFECRQGNASLENGRFEWRRLGHYQVLGLLFFLSV